MRPLSADMRAALAGGSTSFCHCWRIERRDGVVLGLTNHDRDVGFDGMRYLAGAAMRFSMLETQQGLAAHGPQVTGGLGGDAIDAADLQAGLYDHAGFIVHLVDWQNPANRVQLLQGQFGPVTLHDGRYQVSLRGTGQNINQPEGRVFQRQCDAVLGARRCGVALGEARYRWQGELRARRGDVLVLPATPHAAGWFVDGTVVLGTPPQTLYIRSDQKRDDARWITLWQAPPRGLAAGATLTMTVGCDKRFATCHAKFNNAVNFQGFPDLPDGRVLLSVRPG